jgi:hypothetical protein
MLAREPDMGASALWACWSIVEPITLSSGQCHTTTEQMTEPHRTFAEFAESVVLPRSNQRRLDGREHGGNRSIAGSFRYQSRVWKVHADSLTEPLMDAYQAGGEPFKVATTRGGRRCLRLASGPLTRARAVYIYER